ncbi:peptidoglycan-binding protein [Mesorhizobium sp. CAU 1741]|uniref:peptidoglycan-binding protein n=1 Tax=Mesorhizobium sp. CAU 1741 TaxID=3140366 RepID=UPI00325C1011
MNNTRSYLDSINAGRKRRPSTSLEELSETLDEIESRIGPSRDDRRGGARMRPLARRLAAEASYPDAYDNRDRTYPAAPRSPAPDRRRAPRREEQPSPDELNALREELRHQMSTGLKREFLRLRDDIEKALQGAAPATQVAELGVEFERLAAMIHKLAQRTDDRQLNVLRLEVEEVKNALGKLAREDTIQSLDRRWEELDQRWSELATQVAQSGRDRSSDAAVQALGARLEQISEAVGALPDSLALRALEDEMKTLAVTVDRIAHRQDRIAPDTLAAIEDRLDEISRAIAVSAAQAAAPAYDHEPLERIEARISSLAHQLGEVVEDNPASALADQLAMLSSRVEEIGHRVDVPSETIDRLAAQLDAITRKLDHTPAAPDMSGVLRGLEDRFASLSGLLEQRQDDALSQGQSLFLELERRLDQVASRLEDGGQAVPAAQDAQLLQAMDMRFAELASQLEARRPAPADDHAIRDLEARLETISTRLESSVERPAVDPDLIRSLEAQIAGLAAHISQPAAPAREPENLLPRLDQIEKSITESRRDVMEAARMAAEDAVRSFSGSAGDGAVVAGLAEDLKSLEALTRKSDDRNAKTFEAIHDTLLKIVDRIGAVEAGASRGNATPPPRTETARDALLSLDETPSLSAISDAMPLAPVADDGEDRSLMRTGKKKRSAAAAAAEAAADAAREEQSGKFEAAGRLWKLGGLKRALSARGSKPTLEQSEPISGLPEASVSDAPEIDAETPLDPQVANRPLEPGSGAPDLNAIMKRVRDERGQPARGSDPDAAKADFIAAARRAAQAAAAEAEVMKRSPQTKAKGGKFSSLLGNKRKPVLMGIAAVLMALAALQFARSWNSDPETASVRPAAPSVETAQILEQPAPAPAAPSVEEPVLAGQESSARSMMAMAPESPEDVATDWLDTGAATPVAEPVAPAPEAAAATDEGAAEIEAAPAAGDQTTVVIPVEAGPAPLREAAATGDPKALFEIGNRYADARGVEQDMATAAEWYRQAAEQGLAPAQYRIGNMYEKGLGLETDLAQAKSWYTLAAEQGNASAMHNLAVLNAMGADGAADNEAAARWFERAAELGVKDSQFNLGILSAKGVGMPQNLEEAYKWFSLVADAGDRDAAQKRDEIANALRPEQLETARDAAELWRAKPLDAEANAVEIPDGWRESDETTSSVDMKQAVRNIQLILNKNGYQAGTADGVMGQKTKTAIAAFQKDNGMAATGEVDEALVRALLDRR